ncbi:MAG: 4Fe-4S binding protein [Oscillospiraceae bacterium]
MAKKRIKRVAMVLCCGGHEAAEKVERSSLTCDCKQAVENYPDGILECAWGCLGLGSCVAVCRFDAIVIGPRGVPEVDNEKCVGCGLCAKTCPKSLIAMNLPENTITPRCSIQEGAAAARKVCGASCIACRICEKNCPADAIHVIDNCAVIDETKCIACGMCAIKCPRGVIHDANGIFASN